MIVAFALLIGGLIPAQPGFFVASNGSDSNAGTQAAPWLTITKVNSATTTGKTVFFRGGDFFNDSPLNLHSNTNYSSYGTGRAIISGGQIVAGWTLQAGGLNVWRSTWNVGRPRQLWVNGTRVIRARVDSSSYVFSEDSSTHTYSTASGMASWINPGDIEFVYYTEWQNMRVPVLSIDGTTTTMMANPYLFTRYALSFNGFTSIPKFVENSYEIFSGNHAAGTFYHDRAAGFLYMIPPAGVSDPNAATVIAPVSSTIVAADTVSNVTVSNLEFAHTVNPDISTEGLPDAQANYVLTSSSSLVGKSLKAGIHLTNATNVVFNRCLIRHMGSLGVHIENVSTDCGLFGNIIYDISGNGIQVGDSLQLSGQVAIRTTIKDNFIFDTGLEYNSGVGIMQWYADTSLISHNEVQRLYYTGISMGLGWGREGSANGAANNTVSFNDVHYVLYSRMNDGAGIYINSYEIAASVTFNYLHEIGYAGWPGPYGESFNGIYMDDGTTNTTATSNVVVNAHTRQYFSHNNLGPNTFNSNTCDNTSANDYIEQSGSYTGGLGWVANSYGSLNVLSVAAAQAAGVALGAGLEPAYADVEAEGNSLL